MNTLINIVGLFIVVFGGLAISKLLGFSTEAALVGAVVGSASWVFIRVAK